MYNTIVVGVQKTETARRAVDTALALGDALGAHVHLVTAYPKDEGPIHGLDTPARRDAERALDAMAGSVASPKCTTHALPGDPVKVILTVAKEVGADLIVVGNKGMQGPTRLLGSVPNDIAHHAPCAVLVAKTT